jgi:hypothetical protein
MARTSCVPLILEVFGALVLPFATMSCIVRGADLDERVRETWGAAVDGQALSVATTKTTYTPGEPIVLSARFKNIGPNDVKVVQAYAPKIYHLEVLYPDGKSAPLTLFGKGTSESPFAGRSVATLKPGEETRAELELSRLFDFTVAGTYTVSAERSVWKDGVFSSKVKARSNELKIAVVESLPVDSASEGSKGGKGAEKTWGSAIEGQTVSIATDKADLAMGQPVILHICFKNVGQQNVKAAQKDPLGTYFITVLARDGKQAPLTFYGRKAIKRNDANNLEKLTPGESVCDEVVLNRLFDFTYSGVYKVSVKRAIWKDGALSSTLKATSNELQITVR